MSYTKHEFQSGEKLYASELNEMDEQIFKNENENLLLSGKVKTINEILKGKDNLELTVPFPISGYVEMTGNFVEMNNASRTDYILLDGFYRISARLYQGTAGAIVVFYDDAKTPLRDVSIRGENAFNKYEIDIPRNAKYAVFSQYGNYNGSYVTLVATQNGLPAQMEKLSLDVQNSIYDGAAFGAFAKWGVVGDSLSVGNTDDSSGESHARNIYYSWPQYLARKYGNIALNFGQSGATAKSWMSTTNCYNRLINTENICQAYVIGLGANDVSKLDDYVGGVGSTADINTEDASNNADSFCGWYGKIISTIRTTAPQAYIFLLTLPYPRNNDEQAKNINSAIVAMGAMFENTKVVDLSANYDDYYKASEIRGTLVSGHYTAAGYANIACVTAMALSDVINANPSDYKDIPFIPYGTATELS